MQGQLFRRFNLPERLDPCPASQPRMNRTESRLCGHSPTGEPDAGKPPVRFGGRGEVTSLVPTSIMFWGSDVVGSVSWSCGADGGGRRAGRCTDRCCGDGSFQALYDDRVAFARPRHRRSLTSEISAFRLILNSSRCHNLNVLCTQMKSGSCCTPARSDRSQFTWREKNRSSCRMNISPCSRPRDEHWSSPRRRRKRWICLMWL